MKYYYRENITRWAKIKVAGKTHEAECFDGFASRSFLEAALPRLSFSAPNPVVLEVGCGTGVGACFLAERGFRVDGIDIIPTAIDIARQVAAERNLDVRYALQDICTLARHGKTYDMVVDSYCLQGIVLEEDREKVFSNVRAVLKATGYYLVSTAMFDEERFRHADTIFDRASGVLYNRYGEDGIIDAKTGVVYVEVGERPLEYEDAESIEGKWYLPSRRHLKSPALRAELKAAGFDVLHQSGDYGENVICVQAGSGTCLR